MTIYDRIRELRLSYGWSQDELSQRMGYKDRSMITKIEAGKVDISQKKIAKFASVLNTTTSYLMGWQEEFSTSLSPDETILINGYRELPDQGKSYMLQQLTAANALFGEKDSSVSSSESG